MSDDVELKDIFDAMKKESREKKAVNRVQSVELLKAARVPFKVCSADHLKVGEFDFWPATGLFIHSKTKKRGRGVFNLLKRLSDASP